MNNHTPIIVKPILGKNTNILTDLHAEEQIYNIKKSPAISSGLSVGLFLINPVDLEPPLINNPTNESPESIHRWFTYISQYMDIIQPLSTDFCGCVQPSDLEDDDLTPQGLQQTTRIRIEEICSEHDLFNIPVDTKVSASEIKIFISNTNSYATITKTLIAYYENLTKYAFLDVCWLDTTQSQQLKHKLNTNRIVEMQISDTLKWIITKQSKKTNLFKNTERTMTTFYLNEPEDKFVAMTYEPFEGFESTINKTDKYGIPLPCRLYRNKRDEFIIDIVS